MTCPLRRMLLGRADTWRPSIDDFKPWRVKLCRTLEVNYRKAPSYPGSCMTLLEPLIRAPETNLATVQRGGVSRRSRLTSGFRAKFVRQSNLLLLRPCDRASRFRWSRQWMAPHIWRVGAPAVIKTIRYLCFDAASISSNRHSYRRIMGDRKRFIPRLSVIDYLMWDGRPLAEWAA